MSLLRAGHWLRILPAVGLVMLCAPRPGSAKVGGVGIEALPPNLAGLKVTTEMVLAQWQGLERNAVTAMYGKLAACDAHREALGEAMSAALTEPDLPVLELNDPTVDQGKGMPKAWKPPSWLMGKSPKVKKALGDVQATWPACKYALEQYTAADKDVLSLTEKFWQGIPPAADLKTSGDVRPVLTAAILEFVRYLRMGMDTELRTEIHLFSYSYQCRGDLLMDQVITDYLLTMLVPSPPPMETIAPVDVQRGALLAELQRHLACISSNQALALDRGFRIAAELTGKQMQKLGYSMAVGVFRQLIYPVALLIVDATKVWGATPAYFWLTSHTDKAVLGDHSWLPFQKLPLFNHVTGRVEYVAMCTEPVMAGNDAWKDLSLPEVAGELFSKPSGKSSMEPIDWDSLQKPTPFGVEWTAAKEAVCTSSAPADWQTHYDKYRCYPVSALQTVLKPAHLGLGSCPLLGMLQGTGSCALGMCGDPKERYRVLQALSGKGTGKNESLTVTPLAEKTPCAFPVQTSVIQCLDAVYGQGGTAGGGTPAPHSETAAGGTGTSGGGGSADTAWSTRVAGNATSLCNSRGIAPIDDGDTGETGGGGETSGSDDETGGSDDKENDKDKGKDKDKEKEKEKKGEQPPQKTYTFPDQMIHGTAPPGQQGETHRPKGGIDQGPTKAPPGSGGGGGRPGGGALDPKPEHGAGPGGGQQQGGGGTDNGHQGGKGAPPSGGGVSPPSAGDAPQPGRAPGTSPAPTPWTPKEQEEFIEELEEVTASLILRREEYEEEEKALEDNRQGLIKDYPDATEETTKNGDPRWQEHEKHLKRLDELEGEIDALNKKIIEKKKVKEAFKLAKQKALDLLKKGREKAGKLLKEVIKQVHGKDVPDEDIKRGLDKAEKAIEKARLEGGYRSKSSGDWPHGITRPTGIEIFGGSIIHAGGYAAPDLIVDHMTMVLLHEGAGHVALEEVATGDGDADHQITAVFDEKVGSDSGYTGNELVGGWIKMGQTSGSGSQKSKDGISGSSAGGPKDPKDTTGEGDSMMCNPVALQGMALAGCLGIHPGGVTTALFKPGGYGLTQNPDADTASPLLDGCFDAPTPVKGKCKVSDCPPGEPNCCAKGGGDPKKGYQGPKNACQAAMCPDGSTPIPWFGTCYCAGSSQKTLLFQKGPMDPAAQQQKSPVFDPRALPGSRAPQDRAQ